MSKHSKSALALISKHSDDSQLKIEAELCQVDALLTKVGLGPLKQNQWDALACWLHQVAVGQANDVQGTHWLDSDLLKHLRNGHLQLVAGEFDQWVYQNGKAVRALILRRADEAKLFLKK